MIKSDKRFVSLAMTILCATFLFCGASRQPLAAEDRNPAEPPEKWDQFALLVIDIQHFFWNEKMSEDFADFPKNISSLLDFCRSEGIEVIHLRARFSPDMSDWPSFYKLRGKVPCIKGSEEEKVRDFARETPGETVIYKHSFDGFLDTDLDEYLKTHHKKHLLVAGISTGVCVINTCFSAFQKGYLLTLLEDCCAGQVYSHRFITQSYNHFIFETAGYRDIPDRYDAWVKKLDRLAVIEKK